MAWTESYLFATTREPGITVARQVSTPGGAMIVAVDIKLIDLSEFASGIPLGDHGWVAVLEGDRVVGLPRAESEAAEEVQTARERFREGLPRIGEFDWLGLDEVATAPANTPLRIARGDRAYHAVARELPLEAGRALRVVTAYDESMLSEGILLRRLYVLGWILGALCLAFLAGVFFYRPLQAAIAERVTEEEGAHAALSSVGQYTLDRKISEGGVGSVYQASHELLRRPTAIKLLRPDRRKRRDLARFEREVQLTSQLTHPNTIAIYDYGHTPDGAFYCAMEYVEGVTLRELVDASGPVPPARVIRILRQALGSLAEAHEAGLMHRDIKPANIMLCTRGGERDVVKVLDFGLVKRLSPRESEEDLSSVDTFKGTPLYIAPELVAKPDAPDPRSDLYSLAAVGYYLLTAQPLFRGKTAVDTIAMHMKSEPESPSERLGKELAPDLEALLLEMLRKNPADRPGSAREVATRLDACKDAHVWGAAEADAWWEDNGELVMRLVHAGESLESLHPRGSLRVDLGRRATHSDPD